VNTEVRRMRRERGREGRKRMKEEEEEKKDDDGNEEEENRWREKEGAKEECER